jgi:hypothetical protein
MKVLAESDGEVLRLRVNDPTPLIDIPFSGRRAEAPPELSIALGKSPFPVEAHSGLRGLILSRPLSLAGELLRPAASTDPDVPRVWGRQ